MNLWEYEGKEVIIVTTDDQIFHGVACDYTNPQDNDPEIATISIEYMNFVKMKLKTSRLFRNNLFA